MKKSVVISMMLLLTALTAPYKTSAAKIENEKTITTADREREKNQANILLSRLNEINNMDNTNLSGPDKKARRKEVRSIKKQLSELNGGVYLSVGALIIIILLLILFL